MGTVILLTLTGLGLAALYFLVASGLSLVFGLADVLNFAHGLFLGVGAYGTWWAAGNLPGAGLGRVRLRARCRLRGGRRHAGRDPGRAGADPPALLPHHRAGAGHRRPVAGRGGAAPGHLGCGRPAVPASRLDPAGDRDPRRAGAQRRPAADHRGGAGARRDPGVPALDPVRPGDPGRGGEPGDGHRARHRRAQGVHPGLRDRRGGGRARRRARRRLLRHRLARPGRLAADLRVHRGGDRRDGLGRSAPRTRRSWSGWCSSSSTTTARPGWATSAWSGCWPWCCCCARRASPERWQRHDGDRARLPRRCPTS